MESDIQVLHQQGLFLFKTFSHTKNTFVLQLIFKIFASFKTTLCVPCFLICESCDHLLRFDTSRQILIATIHPKEVKTAQFRSFASQEQYLKNSNPDSTHRPRTQSHTEHKQVVKKFSKQKTKTCTF